MNEKRLNQKKQREEFVEAFTARFPDEESCMIFLIEIFRKSKSVRCPHCAAAIPEDASSRKVVCGTCYKTWSITASTLFRGARNIRALFAAIWAFYMGIVIPGTLVALLGNASTSTGWLNKKKIDLIALQNMNGECYQIATAICTSVFSRRSLETPAHEHPMKEQRVIDEQAQAGNSVDSAVTDNPTTTSISDPNQMAILSTLDAGITNFDDICAAVKIDLPDVHVALTMLEISGVVRRMPGNQYARVLNVSSENKKHFQASELTEEACAAVEKDLCTIKESFGGISRKYLGCYFAATSWARKEIDERGALLLKMCGLDGITQAVVQAYVSPSLVLIGR